MVDVSVIIINFNTFELTTKCIKSIYKFTENVKFEVILIDNASTECSAELFMEKFPGIVLVKNSENVGFAKGNNIGMAHASGKVILLLNSDTELIDNAIYTSFHFINEKRNAKIGVLTGKLIYPDGSIQHQCGRFPSIILQLIELFRVQKILPSSWRGRLMLGGFFDHETPAYPDWIWGTFFMFRRELMDIFPDKKLTETYFMYAEDLEWCYIIRKFGYEVYYNPEIKVIHIFSGSIYINDISDFKNAQIQKNVMQFITTIKGKFYFKVYEGLRRLNQIFSVS